jgi:hypothetical protein
LARLFTQAQLPAGLSRPDRLYASKGDTPSLRPTETLAPLSARLGVPEITLYDAADTSQIAAELKGLTGVSLVCWAHTELPEIPEKLGHVTPKPPAHWPDDRFDMVWVLASDGNGGWRLTQVPELLLPGDSSALIH